MNRQQTHLLLTKRSVSVQEIYSNNPFQKFRTYTFLAFLPVFLFINLSKMLKNRIFYYLLIYLTLYSWSILFVQWGALLFSLVIGTIDLRFSSLREKQRGKKFFFTKQSKKKEQCLPQCTFKSHTELDSQPLLHLASQMRWFPKIHCNSQLMKIQFYIIYSVSNIMDMA